MIKIDSLYSDAGSALEFVEACEKSFDDRLSDIAKDILCASGTRFITLAGPSCSGKTTTAAKLTSYLADEGRRARVISIDDFYYSKADMDRLNITDLEGPDAIDLELFRGVLSHLISGKAVFLPVFDFKSRTRLFPAEYIPTSSDIYIFEGIQAIYPQITSVISDFGYKSIFISVGDDIEVLGTHFSAVDIRLMRRTVRDFFHRAADANETMARWQSVVDNENINIYPNVGNEDYTVNSVLPYEIFLMADYYKRVTRGCDNDAVQLLSDKLSAVFGSAVDISMIPLTSVFREFIA